MVKEWYINNKTGELVEWSKVLEDMIENHDYGDPTNCVQIEDCYTYYGVACIPGM